MKREVKIFPGIGLHGRFESRKIFSYWVPGLRDDCIDRHARGQTHRHTHTKAHTTCALLFVHIAIHVVPAAGKFCIRNAK